MEHKGPSDQLLEPLSDRYATSTGNLLYEYPIPLVIRQIANLRETDSAKHMQALGWKAISQERGPWLSDRWRRVELCQS